MAEIENGNVFLVSEGIVGHPPFIFSSFEKAERKLLNQIRSNSPCGFIYSITCVQVDTGQHKRTDYDGSIVIKDGKKIINITRDRHNKNGCKRKHREVLQMNLDY